MENFHTILNSILGIWNFLSQQKLQQLSKLFIVDIIKEGTWLSRKTLEKCFGKTRNSQDWIFFFIFLLRKILFCLDFFEFRENK